MTESEAESDREERKGDSEAATTAQTKRRGPDAPSMAPFLYTTMINKKEDLIFAGGAGKNEMRIFDFDSGNIVALIGNLPKSVLSGALANTTSQFAFGSADSRVRIFDINEQENMSVMSSSTARSRLSRR